MLERQSDRKKRKRRKRGRTFHLFVHSLYSWNSEVLLARLKTEVSNPILVSPWSRKGSSKVYLLTLQCWPLYLRFSTLLCVESVRFYIPTKSAQWLHSLYIILVRRIWLIWKAELQGEIEGQREKSHSSSLLMPTPAITGPGWSPQTVACSGSSTWVQGPKILGSLLPSLFFFPKSVIFKYACFCLFVLLFKMVAIPRHLIIVLIFISLMTTVSEHIFIMYWQSVYFLWRYSELSLFTFLFFFLMVSWKFFIYAAY